MASFASDEPLWSSAKCQTKAVSVATRQRREGWCRWTTNWQCKDNGTAIARTWPRWLSGSGQAQNYRKAWQWTSWLLPDLTGSSSFGNTEGDEGNPTNDVLLYSRSPRLASKQGLIRCRPLLVPYWNRLRGVREAPRHHQWAIRGQNHTGSSASPTALDLGHALMYH